MALVKVARWANGSPTYLTGNDPQAVHDEICSIIHSNKDDNVQKKEVLEFAKNNPQSETHKCFEWNGVAAAEKYRLVQAGEIIRHVVVVETVLSKSPSQPPKTVEVRAFQKSHKVPGYREVEVIVKDQKEYQALLQQAQNELQKFKKRYKDLKELKNILALIP